MQIYTFSSSRPLEEIKDFYKTSMPKNGWEIINETTQAENYTCYFMKDETRMVMVALSSEPSGTRVALMLPTE